MTSWPMLLNDTLPDCGVAACGHAIQLWTGKAPSDADIQIAEDRFSATDYASKVLWGWAWRGIGGHKLGGYARIRPDQVGDAVARFGCAYVALNWPGVGGHAVLVISVGDGVTFVTWGREVTVSSADFAAWFNEAYAIAQHWHPILLWWTLRNWGL